MKRNLIVGITISAIVIIAGAVYWFGIHTRGIEVSIVFDKVDGISQGSKLIFEGVPVGEVQRIKITESGSIIVEARIYKEYKDRVNSSSVFIIESGDAASGSSKKQITVEVLSEAAPPFSQGAKVEGYSSRAQFFLSTGEKALEDAYRKFEKWLDEFQKGLKEFRESEKGRRLKKEMQELMEEARRSAERGIEELKKEIPRLKEKLNEIIEELRKFGRDKEADEFRDDFDRYLKELENRSREVQLRKSFPQPYIEV